MMKQKNEIQLLNLNDYEQITPSYFSSYTIERIVNVLIKQYKFNPYKEDSIYKLVKKINGTIFENVDFYKHKYGSMATDGTKFEIGLPYYELSFKKNFSIAHELGHYILHSVFQNNKKTIAYRYIILQDEVLEYEANEFASNLLMPRKQFLKMYKAYNRPEILSRIFFMPTNFIEIRLRRLLNE